MKSSLFAAVAFATLSVAGAASAQAYEGPTKGSVVLDTRITTVDPKAGDPILTAAGAATGLNANVKSDTVPTVGIRYFFTDNISGELILGTSRHDINASGLAVAKTWVLPPVATVQYNFNPKGKVNPYVGAGLNYMLFYGEKDAAGFKGIKLKNGFGTALQAGVDVGLTGKWSLNLDVKKVFFDTTATTTLLPGTALKSKVNLDPVVASIGVGYRF